MSDVLVLGGGICGLATAMMLARDGHEVTVLERDPQAAPASVDEAIESWDRPGVAQFNLAHYMHARFRHVLEAELPDVRDRLLEAGALRFDILNKAMPTTIEDRSPREGDDRYWTLTGRRPVLETVFAQAAEDERGVKVVRGTHVTGFLTGAEVIGGVPHITGVHTADGGELRADLVIDAMGRRSAQHEWVPAVGGRPPEGEAEDCGFTYYGRYFRSRDGQLPEVLGPLLGVVGTISILTLPGDNLTWMVVATTSSGDMPLKQMRFEEKWRKVMQELPLQAHWLDGDPVGDFQAIAGIMDRCWRFVVDGKPIATGLLAVADAWAYTNPSLGRGVSIGIWHAQRLRDVVRSANDPKTTAEEWDAVTQAEFKPWYDAQVQMDRGRVAEIEALREGREPAGADDPVAQMTQAFGTAAAHDPEFFRAFLEVMGCLSTPEEVLSRPGMFEKMLAAAEGKDVFESPGPTRAELLELLA